MATTHYVVKTTRTVEVITEVQYCLVADSLGDAVSKIESDVGTGKQTDRTVSEKRLAEVIHSIQVVGPWGEGE
ncbi:MAG: hypothetical protein ABGY10_10410 [bacterium]